MLGLVGVALVLGLTMLVLCEVRLIVRLAVRLSRLEPPPRDFFPDPPSQQALNEYWRSRAGWPLASLGQSPARWLTQAWAWCVCRALKT
jgi:hypothetical protein